MLRITYFDKDGRQMNVGGLTPQEVATITEGMPARGADYIRVVDEETGVGVFAGHPTLYLGRALMDEVKK